MSVMLWRLEVDVQVITGRRLPRRTRSTPTQLSTIKKTVRGPGKTQEKAISAFLFVVVEVRGRFHIEEPVKGSMPLRWLL